jgi:transcriptional regulator
MNDGQGNQPPLMSYVPDHFRTVTSSDLESFLSHNRFGSVVTKVDGCWTVSNIPLVFDFEDGSPRRVRGHVARDNEHWRMLDGGTEVLLSVQGPHGYISPQWYDHFNVPTWDYAVVHISGSVSRLGDAELVSHLGEMLASFEGGTQEQALDRYPKEYIDRYLPYIAGFEIAVETTIPVFKLSQDKSEESLRGVLEGLSSRDENGDAPLAALIRAQAANVGKTPAG